MSRRLAATIVLVVTLIICAAADAELVGDAEGWASSARIVFVIWCVALVLGEDD